MNHEAVYRTAPVSLDKEVFNILHLTLVKDGTTENWKGYIFEP